jgi:hypothetical protein
MSDKQTKDGAAKAAAPAKKGEESKKEIESKKLPEDELVSH